MAKLVKYMGKSDVRTIPKGSHFGGQLADPIEKDLVFDKSNNWVVDVEDLSDEAVSLLLAEQEKGSDAFKDVSNQKTIPLNLHQKTFMARSAKPVPNTEAQASADDDEEDDGPDGAITTAQSVSEAPASSTGPRTPRRSTS